MQGKEDKPRESAAVEAFSRRDFLKGAAVAMSSSLVAREDLPKSAVPMPEITDGLRLTGYSDRLSVQQGESIRFMVSSEQPQYRMDIVRLIHGDPNPSGPGFKEELIDAPINSVYPGRNQELKIGSYVLVPNSSPLQLTGSFTLQAWIYPTTSQKGVQGILTKWSPLANGGYGLFIDEDGSLALWVGVGNRQSAKVRTGRPLHNLNWYFAAATYDAESGTIVVYQEPFPSWPLSDTRVIERRSAGIGSVGRNDEPLLVGASWVSRALEKRTVGCHFNGKIEGPRVFSRALNRNEIDELRQDRSSRELTKALVAAWDFSTDISSRRIKDMSPSGMHGETVNMPTRAVTGRHWKHNETNFNHAPGEYGAIHFHEDDLEDAGWEVDFEFHVPKDMPSGIYAARVRAGEAEDHVPFFVRPKKGTTNAPIAYLIPTFTYLAYANFGCGIPGLLSLYDHHSDGSGVCYASCLRPLLDMRPKRLRFSSTEGRPYPRHLSADLYLADWLEAKGHRYDILTDEDLHSEGALLLAPYKVVLTGSHPEYYSRHMLDGLESYLTNGGRLMYLGGNGFYWVTSVDPEQPRAIEVRRWGGTEAWQAEPGEYYHSTTGEFGGLWRHRGRPPQKLVGVGFTSQGWRRSGGCGPNQPYIRQAGSFDSRASFIFEGVGAEEMIGDFESLGLGRGAAGDEIDRFDLALGTPAHALLLATASGFTGDYLHVIEEIHISQQWATADPFVRSDLVYFEYPKGGAVFSAGSISWLGSLSYSRHNNNVSRITDNVLSRFASDNPFPAVHADKALQTAPR